jgi:hypothetical protein
VAIDFTNLLAQPFLECPQAFEKSIRVTKIPFEDRSGGEQFPLSGIAAVRYCRALRSLAIRRQLARVQRTGRDQQNG